MIELLNLLRKGNNLESLIHLFNGAFSAVRCQQ
jgi:hypothetical protein